MPNPMAVFPDSTFKDDTPLNTVNRIKNILKEHGIETKERWNESGVPHCNSLRVTVAGTTFSSSGKGVTKEFALASGYGELMERLQLGHIFKTDQQKGANLSVDNGQDERIDAKELLQRNKKWYSIYARELFKRTGTTLTEEELLMQYADPDGKVAVTPYYCVNTKTQEHLPTVLRKSVYTANGCAAGNTTEEALVQAFSEIVERHYKCQILEEGIPVPDIPEEVLRSCTIAYEIITFLRENGFHVTVKDCSLGTKFPVICVCLIDRKTGKYHTHFGAYPVFEIALQRTLTESFQGRTIDRVSKYEDFCPRKEDALSLRYLMNELVMGTSEKTPEFFITPATIPYNRSMGFTGKNNRERLRECLDFFLEQGLDVLIRDSSCLGFPTYQILIPGYSEVFPHRLSVKQHDMRYSQHAKKTLRDPSSASIGDMMGLMMHLSQRSEKNLDKSTFLIDAGLAADLNAQEEAYYLNAALAHVNYTLGKTVDVLRCICKAIPAAPQQDAEYLICVKRYLTLGRRGYSQDEIRAILTYFHRPETVQRMYQLLESKKNPLDPVTLHCHEKCSPDCRLYTACRQRSSVKLAAIINEKLRQLDKAPLRELLQSL